MIRTMHNPVHNGGMKIKRRRDGYCVVSFAMKHNKKGNVHEIDDCVLD